jgi:four helix bundle protein
MIEGDRRHSGATEVYRNSTWKIQSHRDLLVWQKAMDLTVLVYRMTQRFPNTETYRLVSQMTRSAASVPANIAEGHARGTKRDYSHFLSIAKGSLMETETYVMLSERLNYVEQPDVRSVLALITEMSKMITAIRGKLTEKL